MSKPCKWCESTEHTQFYCRKKPRKPIAQRKPLPRQRKPIKQKGKRTLEYEKWRDTVAKPYLDKHFGIRCRQCDALPPRKEDGSFSRHDVDHILGRGSHPELKMVLSNVQYLCRPCHALKTDGILI